MAAGNFGSPVQLIILLAIAVLLFGGKRLRNLGGDLGGAIKGFKEAMAKPESSTDKSAEAFSKGTSPSLQHQASFEEGSAPGQTVAQHEKSHNQQG